MSRRSPEPDVKRIWQYIGLAGLAVIVFTLVAVAFARVPSTSASDPTYTPRPGTYGPEPTATQTATPVRQVPDGVSLLDQTDRTFTISVIGDSTGAIEHNWVRRMSEWLSETYDRPVEFHQWSVRTEPNGYQPVEHIGDGVNAPIIVWNGSAEGQNIDYSLANWGALVPFDPGTTDLAYINHGHNVAAGTLADEGAELIDHMTSVMPNATIVVVGQNPQTDEGGTLGPAQAENVREWMGYAEAQGYPVVNVLDRFIQYGDYSELLLGAVHPNADGFALWSDAVIEALVSR